MFREFLHENLDMTDDVIIDRIFKGFNKHNIDMQEWVTGFNIFLKGKYTLACLEEKKN